LSFVYFQKSLNIEETIEAKQTFERYTALHGVRVQHYHADNGIFENEAFSNEVMHSGQTISYAVVGAHHQNGKAEKFAIGPQLWPYAMKLANEIANSAPSDPEGVSPLEVFSQTTVARSGIHTRSAPQFTFSTIDSTRLGNPSESGRNNHMSAFTSGPCHATLAKSHLY
jgi:hypothetical protein